MSATRLRDFYLSRDTHVRLWTPRVGREAAVYKWYSGLCFVAQAPLMVAWFVLLFFGVGHGLPALTVLGAVLLGLAIGALIAGWRLNRRQVSATRQWHSGAV